MSATCTHHGCGQRFDPEGVKSPCIYHPGVPVFHEGQKSWSCCKHINKPVLSFDDFLAIKGCSTGEHSLEKPQAQGPAPENAASSVPEAAHVDSSGKEHFGTSSDLGMKNLSLNQAPPPPADVKAPKSTEYVVPQDPDNAFVPRGSRCKRHGCSAVASTDNPGREPQECVFHPGHTIFHEGSKGWSCCKRRVLDFDDFLKIEGCKKSKHLYTDAGAVSKSSKVRVDHYQTPTQVIVSCFAKGCHKGGQSRVTFTPSTMSVRLFFAPDDIYEESFELYGPIDPSASSYEVLSTKCEIALAKADARSWAFLKKVPEDNFIPQYAFTAKKVDK